MNKFCLILLWFVIPLDSWSQGVRKSITILEVFGDGTNLQKEVLEEVFDEKGRIIKEVHIDKRDSPWRKKERNYRYKGKKKYESRPLFSVINDSLISEKSINLVWEITKKKPLIDSIEKTMKTENIAPKRCCCSSGSEKNSDFIIEKNLNEFPFDTALFKVSIQIFNKNKLEYLVIDKNYSKRVSKISKAKFEYSSNLEKNNELNLFKSTFYKRQKECSANLFSASLGKSPTRAIYKSSKILNNRGEVVREAEVKFEYTYNKRGDWVSKTVFYDKNPLIRTTRELTY